MALSPRKENQSMLLHHKENEPKVKVISQDAENNNNDSELKMFSNEEKGSSVYMSNSKGVLAQCLLTTVVVLVCTVNGMPCGYTAILVPQLALENGTLYADQEYGSWIASVYNVATATGCFLSGLLVEGIGRRGCLQFAMIPHFISWLLIGFASDTSYILAGRLFSGLAVGLTAIPSIVLLSETADPGLRGFVMSGIYAMLCFGILVSYTFGALFKWATVANIFSVLPIIMFIILAFVSESPVWLIKKNKMEEAKKALLWLRGNDIEQVNTEIILLQARIKEDGYQQSNVSFMNEIKSIGSILLDPSVLKPFAIINVFNLLQISSGTSVVVYYAVVLIEGVGGANIDAYLATVVCGVSRFVFALLICFLHLKIGRRPLGIVSALGTALASLVLAGYIVSIKNPSYIDNYVLGFCILGYVGANTMGLLVLPGMMSGELFPAKSRGIANGWAFLIQSLIIFFNVKFFPMVNSAIGTVGVFTIFGIFALLVALFLYLFLPETKDRTLQEIEKYFQQDNLMWITRPR